MLNLLSERCADLCLRSAVLGTTEKWSASRSGLSSGRLEKTGKLFPSPDNQPLQVT